MPESHFRLATLLEKETLAQVFSCEICEISRNTFSAEHLWTTASIISWISIDMCIVIANTKFMAQGRI